MATMTARGPRTQSIGHALPHPTFFFLFLHVKISDILFFRKTRGSVSIGGVLEVTFRPSVRKVRFPLHIRLAACWWHFALHFQVVGYDRHSPIQGASH